MKVSGVTGCKCFNTESRLVSYRKDGRFGKEEEHFCREAEKPQRWCKVTVRHGRSKGCVHRCVERELEVVYLGVRGRMRGLECRWYRVLEHLHGNENQGKIEGSCVSDSW